MKPRSKLLFLAVCILSLWQGGIALSRGGGTDSALQSHFMKCFSGASKATLVSPDNQASRPVRLVEVRNEDALLGYGAEVKVISRSGPFFIRVAILPDETVLNVQIVKYPHKKGRAVCRRSFLQQFKGALYGAPLVLGEQVDGVSGATSSASAVTGGVRQALQQVHRYRKAEAEKDKAQNI